MRRLNLIGILILLCVIGSCAPSVRNHYRHLDDAKRLLARGDTLAAISLLKKAIPRTDPPPETFILLGRLYRSKGSIRGRLLSQRILETGLRRFPDQQAIRFELGMTYYAQGFYPDAARCFNSILKSDSSNCAVMRMLGLDHFRKWKRNQGYRDELESAHAFFLRAQACDRFDSTSAFHAGFTALVLGDSTAADSICAAAITRWPREYRFPTLRGIIAYYRGRFRSAAEMFDVALELMEEPARRYYLDISLLIDDDQRDSYRRAVARKRSQIERSFWIEHDPDPTTDINERFLEHLARVLLADLFYADWASPFPSRLTDRAIALIKFGWPTRIAFGLGEGQSGRFEKWTYVRHDGSFQFTFMDEFLNDRFSIPMHAGTMKQALLDRSIQSALSVISSSVPGRLNIYSFRKETGTLENYIYLGLNFTGFGELLKQLQSSNVRLRATVFDTEWNQLEHYEEEVALDPSLIAVDSSCSLLKRIELPFGDYHIAVTCADSLALIQSVFRGDIHGVRFLTDDLVLSDIVLHTDTGRTSTVPVLARGGRELHPAINHRYRAREPLSVFLELYNLTMRKGVSSYEVSYAIYEAPPGGTSSWARIRAALGGVIGIGRRGSPSISQTINVTGDDYSAQEQIRIDIGQLKPGRYELQVTVFDTIAGRRESGSVLFYCGTRK